MIRPDRGVDFGQPLQGSMVSAIGLKAERAKEAFPSNTSKFITPCVQIE